MPPLEAERFTRAWLGPLVRGVTQVAPPNARQRLTRWDEISPFNT